MPVHRQNHRKLLLQSASRPPYTSVSQIKLTRSIIVAESPYGLLTGIYMYTGSRPHGYYSTSTCMSVSVQLVALLSSSSSSGKVSGCMHIYMHGRSWGVVIKFDEVIRSM